MKRPFSREESAETRARSRFNSTAFALEHFSHQVFLFWENAKKIESRIIAFFEA